MINGAHIIIYSTNPEKDRTFFRDVLKLPNVDVGGGWLIFGFPPSEAAFHPGKNGIHELYFMCEDVKKFISAMKAKNIACSPIQEERWGSLTQVKLPGGGSLGVYQPKHPRPGSKPRKKKK